MQEGWLGKTIGGRKIENVPCPNPGVPIHLEAPPVGVLHTIEGSLEAGMGVFRQQFAPHFALDSDQIIQLIPLGMIGLACENRAGGAETNTLARAQIEIAGRSQTKRWLPDAGTLELLADLMATLKHAAEIPLTRPFGDDMPPLPWAKDSFSRRKAGKWGTTAGWFGHVEVPENSHWDPGALEWATVLARARAIAASGDGASVRRTPAISKPPDPLPDWYWTWLRWRLGEGEFKAFKPADRAHRPKLPVGGKGQAPVPAWAWTRAQQFIAARKGPHP